MAKSQEQTANADGVLNSNSGKIQLWWFYIFFSRAWKNFLSGLLRKNWHVLGPLHTGVGPQWTLHSVFQCGWIAANLKNLECEVNHFSLTLVFTKLFLLPFSWHWYPFLFPNHSVAIHQHHIHTLITHTPIIPPLPRSCPNMTLSDHIRMQIQTRSWYAGATLLLYVYALSCFRQLMPA